MSEPLRLALAAAAGTVLGAGYFTGLWWTVRRINLTEGPGALVVVSFLLRNILVAAGFVFVSGGTWQGMVACLGGFLAARLLMVPWLAKRFEPAPAAAVDEGGNADAHHTG